MARGHLGSGAGAMKVLVVDDSRVMRRIIGRTLRQVGLDDLHVVEANDGHEGFRQVTAECPDLVLSDWGLPELSGLDLLHAMRASGDRTPFGFVTVEGSDAVRAAATAAGAQFLLTKPFTAEALREALSPNQCPGADPMSEPPPRRRGAVPTVIPGVQGLRDTLAGLLGRAVAVTTEAAAPPVGGDSGSLVALYVDDQLRSAAVIVVDLALSARVGAAIGLVPAAAADSAIADGALPQDLRDNAHEVLDVLGNTFNREGAPHLRLYALAGTAVELRSDVRSIALKTAPREDILVHVARYGGGVLSVILA